jgi:hypothetical protein
MIAQDLGYDSYRRALLPPFCGFKQATSNSPERYVVFGAALGAHNESVGRFGTFYISAQPPCTLKAVRAHLLTKALTKG